ncbi:MAG TPA: SRPBCC family protein [Acidimicrobiia bacterium]|nr:SRPBCC family protein [Acidimicrobiia bacterium]
MPRQTFSHTSVAPASRDAVWASLDRPKTWEAISGIDRVFDSSVDHEGRLQGFSFDTEVAGRRYRGVATPGRRVEGSAMAWNVRNSEIKGVIDVALSEVADGTEVKVTLDVESASFMSAMFFPVIAGAIGNGLPDAVEVFASGFPT